MKTPVRSLLEDKGYLVHTVNPQATVSAAVELMNRQKVGSVVVCEEARVVGIFTERDVLTRVVAAARDPNTLLVDEVMTRGPLTIGPDTTVEEAMLIVTERRCRHLPVVEGGALHGMVSIGDLTRWVVRHQRNRIEDLTSYITSG